MKNRLLSISKLSWFLIGLFLFSRFIILKFPPPLFSEIIYSYMPYAHLWASGIIPYLQQWYEYPPATIPLFYIPHLIDMVSLGSLWHLNYSQAYKLILVLVDFSVFSLIWQMLKKFKVKKSVFVIGILFYIITTLKAHHFIYDTMDLVFALAIVFGVSAPVLLTKKLKSFNLGIFLGWLGFFLATALKYINAPLGALYFLIEVEIKDFKKNLFKLGLMMTIAFILIWGAPLLLFKSSLQVSFVYHQMRGLQIDSAGATLVRVVNAVTHSEKIVELYKNYEITGPISKQILWIVEKIFPLTIILYLFWGAKKIYVARIIKNNQPKTNQIPDLNLLRLQLTLGYIFLFMLAGKVLSTPFLLWHLPLLAMYPFENVKTQLRFIVPSIMIIFLSMTGIPNVPLGIFNTHILISVVRTVLFFYLFINWFKLKKTIYV